MKNWYPKIFEDVKSFSPLNGEMVTVSELKTYWTKNSVNSTRDYQTVLVKPELVEFINPAEINQVSQSSVHPIYDENYEYVGDNSVFISNIEGLSNVEPLVNSWESANHFSFQIAHIFLMTYGLTPRLTNKYLVWDDMSKPETEIAKLIPTSNYSFPEYSESFVCIKKDYLQDYAMLRKRSLIQVFCETRIVANDKELEELIKENDYFERTTESSHFRIQRLLDNKIHAEITGYRIIDLGNKIKISNWGIKVSGHKWPGFDRPISRQNAKHWEYVYVTDEVLEKYEQDNRYDVYPESGSVSYKNQWSVSRCQRVGRNHIKIELFKLYEGTPNEVIDYWNKHAVDKSEIDINGKNISERAKSLVFSYLLFGELLAKTLSHLFEYEITSQNIINLNRKDLEYYGWYTNESVAPITHHLKHNLSINQFLSRQKKMNTFLVENLEEKFLRESIKRIGIDIDKFKKSKNEKFRSIKLLNIVINYLQISLETGLDIIEDATEISSR